MTRSLVIFCVALAVSYGVAVVIDSPKSPAARAIEKMADVLIANNVARVAAQEAAR